MLDQAMHKEFLALRRQAIAMDYHTLNDAQREGVLTTQGPLLLLAGAGSGKTTVLINRIDNLVKFGQGGDSAVVPDEITSADVDFLREYVATPSGEKRQRMERLCAVEPALPWSILAITFTNKAAGELKERLEKRLGTGARDIWASTFHSACVKFLRRDIQRLGFPSSFTIYDASDAERVVKELLKELEIDDKNFPPKTVAGYISRAKGEALSGAEFLARCQKEGDFRKTKIAQIYVAYEERLKRAGALDFDDLILDAVRLLEQFPDIRAFYQKKFRYILIDEYQDTNYLQYRLATLLAAGHQNLCVVGDDDQSIYRFRGATIENILSFEQEYKSARVIRLEQNYRSKEYILQAANGVIRCNTGRKGKELWTKASAGDKLSLYTAMHESDESHYIATCIMDNYTKGRKWKDHAILYRMNALSNGVEKALKERGIPYRIIGGTRFFDRAEVKDMMAYLCVINNPEDDLRLVRIINNPTRGIGARTVEQAREIAAAEGVPLWQVLRRAGQYEALHRAAPKLGRFVELIEYLRQLVSQMPLADLYQKVMDETGYAVMLESQDTVEDRTRLDNVRELQSSIRNYMDNSLEPSLEEFLLEMALYTELDNHDNSEDSVVMMTMHAAKGLEFPVVFVVGAEENVFPGQRAVNDPDELEEERRLCYVAITRAREQLHIICANQRMLFGRTTANRPSRFLSEIPADCVQHSGHRNTYDTGTEAWGYSGYGNYGRQVSQPSHTTGTGGQRPTATPVAQTTAVSRPPAAVAGGYTPARPKTGGANLPSYRVGDMVVHKAFGEGMVLALTPMGGDAMIEIAFDTVGTKRLMVKAAAQLMTKK